MDSRSVDQNRTRRVGERRHRPFNRHRLTVRAGPWVRRRDPPDLVLLDVTVKHITW